MALKNGNGNGKGEAPDTGISDYDSFHVAVEALATGDLTGDGTDESAVLLSCTPQPSNFRVEEVQVFGSGGKAVSVLPQVPAEPRQPLPPEYDPSHFSIRGGALVTGMTYYAPTDSHASGPSIHRTLTWHWNGHTFTHSALPLGDGDGGAAVEGDGVVGADDGGAVDAAACLGEVDGVEGRRSVAVRSAGATAPADTGRCLRGT
ncbi:hypothetical protein ACIBJF_47035 [Streptomyces sp. NPDC050743]|uniref:hypothetical protein n=1 Tax=Streptomyces sp. NPDC050743 TaxID=3365634 RepID=UPI0037B5D406